MQLEEAHLLQTDERTVYRNNQINSELTEIKEAIDNEISLQKSAKTRSIENLKQISELRKNSRLAQRAWEKVNNLLASQRQGIQLSAKQMQGAAFYVKTCINKIIETEHTINSVLEDLQHLTQTYQNLLKEKKRLDEAETLFSKQLEVALTERRLTEQVVLEIRQEMEDMSCYLQKIDNSRLVSEQESYSLRETINHVRLGEQAANMTINHFDDLLTEAKADTRLLLPLIDKKNTAILQSDINWLTLEIAALGYVNLAALEEFEAACTRESSLQIQLKDLAEAITTLEDIIHQIDRETQLRLQDTFVLVNKYLSEIFPMIFAGGQAKLKLSGDKILDSGLILVAQPPGKKNSSIHSLSGGEKALTALALVFSLFQLNPAPFCLLDEVDAPLDDSNTHRFCELVKNMSKHTQFLFISHNRISMEIAQQLIGVTMQEQGISRIVAVDIAHVSKERNGLHKS